MMRERTRFIDENRLLLDQLRQLIASVPLEVYRRNDHPFFGSGVGKHVRHILDFYEKFLSGCRSTIDYDDRRRERRLETDPAFAAERAAAFMDALHGLVSEDLPAAVTVRVETHGQDATAAAMESTCDRELAYLSCHTVHHFALIATLLRIQGVTPPARFGVAPATLRNEMREGEPSVRGSSEVGVADKPW